MAPSSPKSTNLEPITAAAASTLLDEIRQLMEIHGENPFKVRAYERASSSISGREDLVDLAKKGLLTSIEGVGKGIAEVLTEFLLKRKSSLRDELLKGIPEGLLEITQIPGLGPKKARQLVEELDVHSVRELEYACKENRLLGLKGFGIKAQQKILDGIAQMAAYEGRQRLVDAFPPAEKLVQVLADLTGRPVVETGEFRRRLEILSSLDFLVEAPRGKSKDIEKKAKAAVESFQTKHAGLLPIQLHFAESVRWGYEWVRTTATQAHWEALGSPEPFDAATEEAFYEKLGLPWIPPEARESGEEVGLAKSKKLEQLLPWNGLRGIFHNHTTRSDGVSTLEQMVLAAKKLGYEYIGISDHSKSAFYARGLNEDALRDQEKEVRTLQDKHPEIRIFWGIESDILADGSLDYDEKVLKRFDFVIASIHSRFKMEREAMTDRLLEAIRHPCTRFIGHITGRLLLGRKGYDVDMERLIQEAAKRDVAIELNASPARLDIDWRWGGKLRACGTPVSINPDAHSTEEIEDTRFGVAMARKALLPVSQVINTRSAEQVERWLKRS